MSLAHYRIVSIVLKIRCMTSIPKTDSSSTSRKHLMSTRDLKMCRIKMKSRRGRNPRSSKAHRRRTSTFMRERVNWMSIWMHRRRRRIRSYIKYMESGSIWSRLLRRTRSCWKIKEGTRRSQTLQTKRARRTLIHHLILPTLSPSNLRKIEVRPN